MRIGILGGTFDPPHSAHLALAHKALDELRLDEVMFLPVNRNPLKKIKMSPAKDRLEMVKLAIRDEPNFSVSDIEIARGGPSYAIDTMNELTYARPAEYWFILGSDALRSIAQWKQPEKLLRLTRLAVAPRSRAAKDQLLASLPPFVPSLIDWLDMPPMDISATELRQRMQSARPVAQWIKPEVAKYIEDKRLYR
jgi:nicotinate-nucleotide adenylyltransferase